jgi:pyruvate-ferredoxin/flavodoxin oxidoreductase
MREQIAEIVDSNWQARLPGLVNTLADALRQVQGVLQMEDYYRTAYKGAERLGRSFGGFGSESLDLKALSSVLQRSHESRGLEKRRYQRLQMLAGELEAARAGMEKHPPRPAVHELRKGAQALEQAFEAHAAPLADALRLVRLARLEARGRYDPAEHDAQFARFNWRQLDNAEMALCPPFVVQAEPDAHRGSQLGALLELASSGRPVKIVLLHTSWHTEHEETGRAAALRSLDDVPLLFLALRNVHYVQTSPAAPTPMAERIARALESPRPAVISVFAQGAEREDFAQRAALVLTARAFPHFVYDPERAADFVSCLDLSDNPEPAAQWITQPLVHATEDGGRAEEPRALTFADYAVTEPEFSAQFTPIAPAQAGAALPLVDYLELDPARRWNRLPFVYALDERKRLIRVGPSQAMLAHTADRMHLWNTLQELGGIQNPYVQAAERTLREMLLAEKAAALAEQKTQLEAQYAAQQQEQVSAAMRNLAQRLTGMTVSGAAPVAAAGAPAAAPAPAPAEEAAPAAAPAAAAPKAPVSNDPWIDQRLCTSCDECIAINKNLFSYNGNKKAVLKDPKAGPYKDIVRAAEKCSSGAIHPGLPLDPGEKDVEKWIKRAEKYQ